MPAVHGPVGMDWREYIGGQKCSDRCSKLRKKPSSARGGGDTESAAGLGSK